ncbi:AP2-like ethylene-responsive transcription factor AIL6 isoform X1 [Solanum lycopersicum]|uniref:AP2-like ethylene-responsive transcription factor AIL6 isoform X1 n=1 Tax=Solanum lycopersicum TaxID=4081 RepID=UPI0002BC7F0E|nr:AP2-like ethylene-responsive transcription factor AIL6 [Solanum lycopersicum]
MAPENNNWLSFSLSSMEMLNSSSSSSSMLQSNAPSAPTHQYYFADNFYPHGWMNVPKTHELMYSGDEKQIYHPNVFIDSQIIHHQHHHHPPPKLEDFFGGETETQDSSSLTHIYDHHHHHGGGAAAGDGGYFNNGQQDVNHNYSIAVGGFQTLPTNSGSEVDDSQVMGSEFATESSNEIYPPIITLGVNNNSNTNSEKAIVTAVNSEGCKKITDTFGQRTSIYRGVTRHRWTGRYEAHLWDNSCKREGQARKGRQVYLGGYDKEDKAARSYDLAALKYWGTTATTNFPASDYTKEIEEMKHMTKQEFIASLRRKSSGFSRGASMYRGVTRHHQQGRWQARIGRVAGNKDLYLGTFATEEEAAEAYDIAAIKFRGLNAVTNFEMNRYDVEAIMKSSLPIGGAAKRLKISLESEQKQSLNDNYQQTLHNGVNNSSSNNSINFGAISPVSAIPCGLPFDANQPYYHHSFFPHLQYSSNDGGASDHTSGTMPLLPPPAEIFIWPHQSY